MMTPSGITGVARCDDPHQVSLEWLGVMTPSGITGVEILCMNHVMNSMNIEG